MTRKRPNIWRVYMDLLANFLGLVLIGGAGISILAGGAVMHSKDGPSAFAKHCSGSRLVQAGSVPLTKTTNERIAFRTQAEHCALEARYPSVIFPVKETTMADIKQVQEQVCEDVFRTIMASRDIKFAKVELIGRTSEEFKETDQCGVQPNSLNDAILCPSCSTEDRRKIQAQFAILMRSATGPVAGDRDFASKAHCNAPLAFERAHWVKGVCLQLAASRSDDRTPSLTLFTDRVVVGLEPATSEAAFCGPGGDECNRTVSVRLRLPAKGRGYRPQTLAMAPGEAP